MAGSPIARLFLIAALVFSQTLYAGHSLLHDNGSQRDCQICLQAAPGAGLPCSEAAVQPIDRQPQHAPDPVCAGLASHHGISHPTRAPPFTWL